MEEACEPVGPSLAMDGMSPLPPLMADSPAVEQLSQLATVLAPADAPLEDLLAASSAFPRPFPIHTMRVKKLLKDPGESPDLLASHANSAYPLLLEGALFLTMDFLDFKRRHGSRVERELYSNMDVVEFVQRLLEKRAASFFGPKDRYLLLNGKKGYGGWNDVGTDQEKSPLLLKDCLSYDEMKISSLLTVSSNTVFINEGDRKNDGLLTVKSGNVEKYGVILGIVGPRLAREGSNEWEEILVTEDQNTIQNGYGENSPESENDSKFIWRRTWAKFYGIQTNLPLFEEASKNYQASKGRVNQRFTALSGKKLFDNLVYHKRITVAAETLLLEAEHRAAVAGKKAFVHVVGLGLGLWCVSYHQEKEFLSAFASCLNKLGSVLPHVSDVRFGWFQEDRCGDVGDGGTIGGGIRIHFDRTPPQQSLRGEHEGKLLVVTYAWDMNALPGNEFWCGELGSSSDPAAACSTQVAELHNAHVNRAKVCGANLHVASLSWGVLHVAEYARRKLMQEEETNSCINQKQNNQASSSLSGKQELAE